MLQLSKNQIEQFLRDENLGPWIDKQLKGEFLINSPFTHDTKKKCGVRYSKNGIWNDYKTGYGGSWWKFVKEVKNFKTLKEATFYFLKRYYTLEELRGISFNNDEPEIKEIETDIALPEDAERLIDQSEYLTYLKNRHFTPEMIEESKVFISRAEKRVIFPIYESGKLTFFARRSIDQWNTIRWLNSSGQGADPVWNLDGFGSVVYIFEGIFDAARVWPNGVAVFGNTMRPGQIEKVLARSPHKIVVVGDNDGPGRFGQRRTANKLSDLHKNVWIHLWDKKGPKDFGDMDEVKLREVRWDNAGKMLWELNEK